jgi:quinol monooxygenase YgiN
MSNPTTLAVIARFTLKPGHQQAFLTLCTPLIEITQQEAGCLYYQLFADNTNAQKLIMMESWESDAALQAHLDAAHTQAFFRDSASHLAGEIQLETYLQPTVS